MKNYNINGYKRSIIKHIENDLNTFYNYKIDIVDKPIGAGITASVHKLIVNGSTDEYVIKVGVIDPRNNMNQEINKFMKEIKIGLIKNVDSFGLRIHAYDINPRLGYVWYIMDDIKKGNENKYIYSLTAYFRMFDYKKIHHAHKIYKLFGRKLLNFYKNTKGYHGDLHTNNIAVILNNKNSKKSIVKS